MQRTTDTAGKAAFNGAQSTTTMTALYDVVGELRSQVFGLQNWVRALIGEQVQPGNQTQAAPR